VIKVERPLPSDKKINTHDDFELAYLRHQYFRRVKYNPTEQEMLPYMKIVEHFTKNTFFVYINLFKTIGMYQDDILNIGRVHLVSFLGLYSLEQNEVKKLEFEEKFEKYQFKKPEAKDYDQKNKANFTMFFKQRMEDLVRVCHQKIRNVKGQNSEEYLVFCGSNKPPKNYRKLLREYQELGYKKVDFAVFKSVRKKAGVCFDASIFEFGGTWYVAIALEKKNLEIEDLVLSGSNPYDNYHNKRPDDLYEEKEESNYQAIFESRSGYRKKTTLKRFIAKNKNNRHYKEEIMAAKRLLKTIED
jgi:hypothetical protein